MRIRDLYYQQRMPYAQTPEDPAASTPLQKGVQEPPVKTVDMEQYKRQLMLDRDVPGARLARLRAKQAMSGNAFAKTKDY